MGRHSAPDDDDGTADTVAAVEAPAVVDRPTPRGRHSAPDDPDAEVGTVERSEPAEPPKAPKPAKQPKPAKAEKPPKAPKTAKQPKAPKTAKQPKAPEPARPPRPIPETRPTPPAERKPSETAADLRLLRENPALRSRVIAAIVVPFVVFFVVLLLAGRLDVWAVWVWIPLILCAILAGSFLDVAHHRADTRADDRAEDEPAAPPDDADA